jgi:hypothetical protein
MILRFAPTEWLGARFGIERILLLGMGRQAAPHMNSNSGNLLKPRRALGVIKVVSERSSDRRLHSMRLIGRSRCANF